ncbi:MAG: type II toxin-antitoxin system HicA family toxin [Deltaproteobacteria bacterium]|nr:type II toxin-antitoxin system HicA family toxin [Deltaproteobacteria bacterium]
MARYDDLLARILRGAADANIPFNQLCHLLRRLGFEERIRGDHHIFTKDGLEEILNLQPRGHHAKPYQVKQVRGVIVKYRLAGGNDEK